MPRFGQVESASHASFLSLPPPTQHSYTRPAWWTPSCRHSCTSFSPPSPSFPSSSPPRLAVASRRVEPLRAGRGLGDVEREEKRRQQGGRRALLQGFDGETTISRQKETGRRRGKRGALCPVRRLMQGGGCYRRCRLRLESYVLMPLDFPPGKTAFFSCSPKPTNSFSSSHLCIPEYSCCLQQRWKLQSSS